jgi:hypothetical protein
MTIYKHNLPLIIVATAVLTLVLGILIHSGDSLIAKREVPFNPLMLKVSAQPVPDTKVEAPKTEPTPVVAPVTEVVAPAPVAPTPEPAPIAVAYVSGNCESFRPLVQKYFGSATEAAMIVMQKESSCNPTAVSETNDYGLFQLNGMQIFDPEANIAAAVKKYLSPRRGSTPNFSAWYAVCTPNQVPKYSGIWCN